MPLTADATLTFETELVSVQKQGGTDDYNVFGLVQFVAVPAGILLLVYYIYDKYRKAPTKKELKEERRGLRSSSKKKKH